MGLKAIIRDWLEPKSEYRAKEKRADRYQRFGKIEKALSLYVEAARHYEENGFYLKAVFLYGKALPLIQTESKRLEMMKKLVELYQLLGLTVDAQKFDSRMKEAEVASV